MYLTLCCTFGRVFLCVYNYSIFNMSFIFFSVLHDASFLPRYTYHRSLVDWYMEGLPKDIIFTGCHIESCSVIIGGITTDEERKILFGETALSEKMNVKGLQKGYIKNLRLKYYKRRIVHLVIVDSFRKRTRDFLYFRADSYCRYQHLISTCMLQLLYMSKEGNLIVLQYPLNLHSLEIYFIIH